MKLDELALLTLPGSCWLLLLLLPCVTTATPPAITRIATSAINTRASKLRRGGVGGSGVGSPDAGVEVGVESGSIQLELITAPALPAPDAQPPGRRQETLHSCQCDANCNWTWYGPTCSCRVLLPTGRRSGGPKCRLSEAAGANRHSCGVA